MSPRESIEYHPHIDGLRAVAVLLVLLYHLGFATFKGGYIGVDVFFVISGYLISRLIYVECVTVGRFDFAAFYLRRARRILPALFVTLYVTLAWSWFILAPSDLLKSGLAVLYSSLSVSNFFFWSEAGYFDSAPEDKPLLHTWSLGVEEQFYLVWPLMVAGCLALRRRFLPILLVGIFGTSLLLNLAFQSGVDTSVLGGNLADGKSTIFYLPVFRFYEFAIGAFLALGVIAVDAPPRRPPGRVEQLFHEVSTVVGFLLVLASAVYYTTNMVFPSYLALVPCLGTALLIRSGGIARAGSLLRTGAMTWIGRVSYSLYLVHWPVIALYLYRKEGDLLLLEQLLIAAVSLVLASGMYVWVETPFRKIVGERHVVRGRSFVRGAVAGTVMFVGVGWYVADRDGMVRNRAAGGGDAQVYAEIDTLITNTNAASRTRLYRDRDCWAKSVPRMVEAGCDAIDPGRFNVLVLGDSVGDYAWHGIRRNLPVDRFNLLQYTPSGCTPVSLNVGTRECRDIYEYIFQERIATGDIDLVVLFSRIWEVDDLANTLGLLREHGQDTIVVGPPFTLRKSLQRLILEGGVADPAGIARIAMANLVQREFVSGEYRARLRQVVEESGHEYYGLAERICDYEGAWRNCRFVRDKVLLTVDNHHLTPPFAEALFQDLADQIRVRFH